jgi:capsular exopolysaccharide synthesis family protein
MWKLFGKVAPSLVPAHHASRPAPPAQPPSIQEPADALPPNVDQHLVSILAPSSFEAEQYRVLRHVLKGRRKADACTTIAVSSAIPGDGKTTTAINLAAALAQDPDMRVLLVDADIRRPSISKYLGLDDASGTGLVDMVRNPALELKRTVRLRSRLNFSILQAGAPPEAPHEVLNSPRLGLVVEEARRCYDYIVLDSPPVVPVPDCRILAKLVDGILLVVASHKTPRQLLAAAMDAMEPEKLIGLVFNNDDRPLGGYGYYYHGYYSAYGQPRKA